MLNSSHGIRLIVLMIKGFLTLTLLLFLLNSLYVKFISWYKINCSYDKGFPNPLTLFINFISWYQINCSYDKGFPNPNPFALFIKFIVC